MPLLLDETGLTIQPASEIVDEMTVDFREKFGAGMLVDADTPEGKIIGIVAERNSLIQQLMQAVYDAFDPSSASGVSLERIGAMTAVTRNPATPSLATLYLAGTPSTVIPVGSLAAVQDSAKQFQTLAEVTLGANGDIPLATGTAAIAITSITRSGTVASVTTTAPHGLPAGAIVTISGATGGDAALYNVTAEIENIGGSTFDYNMTGTPGGSAAGTPVYQDEGLAADHITFATIVARSVAHGLTTGEFAFIAGADEDGYNGLYLVTVLDVDHFEAIPTTSPTVTPATGSYNADEATAVQAESVDTGPIAGESATITTIVNAISGWDRVENLEAAVLGEDIETDAEFRARRVVALLGLGNSTLEAIRGDLLVVSNVTQALVFENPTSVTVGSRPPKSVEALVVGGADQDIGDALFDSKAAGIETYGTEGPVTHTDSQGNDHDVLFSRPAERDIWLEIDFTIDSDLFPADGLTQAEDAILAFGATLNISDDVIVYPQLVAAVGDIPGILDMMIRIEDTADGGGDPSPTLDNNIAISETQISAWDRSRLTFITV